jgi:hypothetical protein
MEIKKDESPYCKTCGSCGETGCCSPLSCDLGENCEYPKTNLNELKFGFAMNEFFQKEIYPNLSKDLQEKYDAAWDVEYDRWYR